jgi:hypothetical protein
VAHDRNSEPPFVSIEPILASIVRLEGNFGMQERDKGTEPVLPKAPDGFIGSDSSFFG